uniref:DNA polymerase delta interacting protein 2 n=1 Tax=Myotis myotis TaxID=51298 RepID=A0A7J7T7E8_MYOMY|nr:DNA polymerase delta interacting protein 2 [Myotis myotis]
MAGCVARRVLAVGSRWWSRSLTGARGPRPLCAAGGPGAFLPAATTTRRHLSSRNRPEGKVLETVGVFEVPKQNGKYETGQLFLHSVFGYRGVVLFPWQARLYDRDVASAAPEKAENPAGHGSKEVKGKTHTYYQVLIDARDCPHISQRSQTEAVTFLANHDDSRALYAIPVPSPWKAIKMRRHHPQAFTGRPAEALNGQAQSLNSCHPTIAAELSPSVGHSGSLNWLRHLNVGFFLWWEGCNFSPEDPCRTPPRLASPVSPAYTVFQ